MNKLESTDEALSFAQKLRDFGQVADALIVGERGLSLEGSKYSLGSWLGPIEEARGQTELAQQAYQAAFNSIPSIELYQTLKRLSGGNWQNLQSTLIDILKSTHDTSVLVDVYLFEEDWDAAIQLVEKADSWYTIIEKVADAVIPYRPDWVIQASIKQAEGLIEKTQSKYYRAAARWLAKAKQAYTDTGRNAEWQAYLTRLKATYSRRPALQAELDRL